MLPIAFFSILENIFMAFFRLFLSKYLILKAFSRTGGMKEKGWKIVIWLRERNGSRNCKHYIILYI